MRWVRRTGTATNDNGTGEALALGARTCITPKCENTTQSFYCDACWQRQEERRTA